MAISALLIGTLSRRNGFYSHVAQQLCSRPAPVGKRFSHSMKRAAVQHIQSFGVIPIGFSR